MTMRRAAAAFLAASTLVLLGTCAPATGGSGSVVGRWGGDDPKPNITIADDGTVTGTDGCNRITGTGTIEGATVSFGDIATTLMACPGSTDVLDPFPASATVEGDELVLRNADGTELRRLPRAEPAEG